MSPGHFYSAFRSYDFQYSWQEILLLLKIMAKKESIECFKDGGHYFSWRNVNGTKGFISRPWIGDGHWRTVYFFSSIKYIIKSMDAILFNQICWHWRVMGIKMCSHFEKFELSADNTGNWWSPKVVYGAHECIHGLCDTKTHVVVMVSDHSKLWMIKVIFYIYFCNLMRLNAGYMDMVDNPYL